MAKTLANMDLLVGQEDEIAMMDFRKHPGDVIAQVQLGKVYFITKSGKRVAILKRLEPDALDLGAAVRRLGLAGK